MKNDVTPYPVPTICDFCGSPVIFTSNAEIYGKEYGSGKCYKCTSCDSYVGVHENTLIPLGRLANKELRKLKKQCHNMFDPIWNNNNNKYINREQAYGRLANLLGIPASDCHFGWFDKDMLLRCLDIMKNKKWYIGVNWKKEIDPI